MALKELPFLMIMEVALPKIYGFEVCKRLKSRAETKDMKFFLLPSIYDKSKYRRDPASLYGADDYIEEHDLSTQLIEKINALGSQKEEVKQEKPAPALPPRPEASPSKASVEVKTEVPPPVQAQRPASGPLTR